MQLAQLNIARLLAPVDSPQIAGFVAQLDEINALADADPGLVWRHGGDALEGDTVVGDDPLMIFNLSVWRDTDSLFEFVYRSTHTRPMASRRDWFERPTGPHMVLWWVADGHRPDIAEALERLALLSREGAGPAAFDFRQRFTPDGTPESVRRVAVSG